ncbi:MAG: caspase family protein [Candidatus Bathyarchaeia archaeon]
MLVDSEATRSAIQNAITTIASKEDSDDVVLFIFSGHGTYGPDVAPLDEVDGFDEYICPHDLNNIRDDELTDWLSVLDSKKIVAIFDSCFSGEFMKGLRTLLDVRIKTSKIPLMRI